VTNMSLQVDDRGTFTANEAFEVRGFVSNQYVPLLNVTGSFLKKS
jgi:hypothetical protein